MRQGSDRSLTESPRPFDVFISYARDPDEQFAERLYGDLAERGVRVWWDKRAMMNRGRSFLQELRDGVESCERLLFIVGPQSLASDYCLAELDHGFLFAKAVVPLLRQRDFEQLPPGLSNLDCIDFGPLRPYADALEELSRKLADPVPRLGKLLNLVPRLPPHFFPRPAVFDQLAGHVLADLTRPVVVDSRGQVTGLHGLPGTGKSVVAASFARATEVRRAFEHGVVWVKVEQTATAHSVLAQVGQALGGKATSFAREADAQRNLPELLAEKTSLVVLDDVWKIPTVNPLLDALSVRPQCRVLITTRDSGVVRGLQANEVSIDEFEQEEALQVMAAWTGTSVESLPLEAREVARACGCLPLAVAMIAASVGNRPERWRGQLERLRTYDLNRIRQDLPGYPHPTLARAIEVSLMALDPHDDNLIESLARQRYHDLAVFPRGCAVPPATLAFLWGACGVSRLDSDDIVRVLAERSLARLDENGDLWLHDLQTDFVRSKVGDATYLHRRFLDQYRGQLAQAEDWASMPDDEPYLWDQLFFHLRRGELRSELRAAASDVAYLGKKIWLRGVEACLRDLADVSACSTSDTELALLKRVIDGHAHMLVDLESAAGTTATLTARLAADERLEALCERSRRRLTPPYLFPRWPLPDQADPALLWSHKVDMQYNFGPIVIGGEPLTIALGGGYEGSIAILEAATGAEIKVLDAHDASVTSLRFDPSGSQLASADMSGRILVWSTDGWKVQHDRYLGKSWIRCVDFDGGGQRLAACDDAGNVYLWEMSNRTESALSTLEMGDHDVESDGDGTGVAKLTAVAIDCGGRRLAVGNERGLVSIIEWQGRKIICTQRVTGWAKDLRFDDTGERVAIGTVGRGGFRFRTLSLPSGRWVEGAEYFVADTRGSLQGGSAMSAAGDHIAVAQRAGAIVVLETRTKSQLAMLTGNFRGAGGVAISPENNYLVSVSDEVLRLWEVGRARKQRSHVGHHGWVLSVDFDTSGNALVSCGNDQTVYVWTVEDCHEPMHIFEAERGVTQARFLDSANDLVVVDGKGNVEKWPLPLGKSTRMAHLTTDALTHIAVCAARRIAIMRYRDEPLCVVDLVSGQTVKKLDVSAGELRIALRSDGQQVATVGSDNKIQLWDWEFQESPRHIEPPGLSRSGYVVSLAYDGAGAQLAMGFSEGTVAVVSVANGQVTWHGSGHNGWCSAVAFDPSTRLLASADCDGQIFIWHSASGAKLAELRIDGWIHEVTWHPSGSLLALAGASGLFLLELVANSRSDSVN